jgi:hypothetical protein
MAKIKKINLRPQMWLVKITVDDPACVFSINPNITFQRLVKASNIKSAIKGASAYCNRKMEEYPGTSFTHCTDEAQPYWYPVRVSLNEPSEQAGFTVTKL